MIVGWLQKGNVMGLLNNNKKSRQTIRKQTAETAIATFNLCMCPWKDTSFPVVHDEENVMLRMRCSFGGWWQKSIAVECSCHICAYTAQAWFTHPEQSCERIKEPLCFCRANIFLPVYKRPHICCVPQQCADFTQPIKVRSDPRKKSEISA